MHGPTDSGGFLSRIRENEGLRRLTGGHPELIIFGAPAALIAVIAIIVAVVVMGGGSGGGEKQQAVAETPAAAVSTTPEATPTARPNAGLKTPISVSPGSTLTLGDLAARGTTGDAPRGDFRGQRLVIPKIGVDAPFTVRQVPTDGQMPNPRGPEDIAYYDFSQWPGLGGLPGKGGNVVLAGHVDYINYGPAVFWKLNELGPGDRVQIQLDDGTTVEYQIVFNKLIENSDADWSGIVQATKEESITLITCAGNFVNGGYTQRMIIWGQRV